MKTYYRLTFEEREEISRLLSQKCSFNAIAKYLERNKGTIYTYISTYETNYLLVEEKNPAKAKKVLSKFCDIK